ncbi:hypothetical protein KKG24_02080 [Patescibacteria group bacterium]|nr:hypothetical protein [Patescibacteria group bacterium]
MNLIIWLAVAVALFVLGFISWVTWFSILAIVAGIFLLICTGVGIAIIAGITTIHPVVRKIIIWMVVLCLVVIVWAGINKYRKELKAEKKADKIGMANSSLCKNDESKWVAIPTGFYKDGTGACVEGTPPPPPAPPAPPVEALVLEKECLTPCSSFVGWNYKVRTDGDPVRVYNANYSWEIPGKGMANPPKNFKPGDAQIISSGKNPQVGVWVYKKITVPRQ